MSQAALNGAIIAGVAFAIAFASAYVIAKFAKLEGGMSSPKFRLIVIISFVVAMIGTKVLMAMVQRELMREANKEEMACWKSFRGDMAVFGASEKEEQWGHLFKLVARLEGQSSSRDLLADSVKIDADPGAREALYLKHRGVLRDQCLIQAKVEKEARMSKGAQEFTR